MKQIIDSYFDFSRNERRGISLLFIILLIGLLTPTIYGLFNVQKPTDFSAFNEAVLLFESGNAESMATERSSINDFQATQNFVFNPNILSADSLALLGLSKRVVNNITNYRKKGGRFFKKEDFKKIYSLADSTYSRLEAFISIPQKQKVKPVYVHQKTKSSTIETPTQPAQLFNFDPNTATKEQLIELGLSQKVVNILSNFINKGGRFYKKEDLKKIYGLTSEKYETLAPYIFIKENSSNAHKKVIPAEKPTKPITIDINNASANEWQKLKGIGPYYSEKIVDYRNKLGGFHQVEQLGEIYHFPDSVIQKIKPFLIVSNQIKKTNINLASQEDLTKHPYLNYKQAKIIVKYRNQHGPYQSLDDLLKVKVLQQELITKISPYFSTQ